MIHVSGLLTDRIKNKLEKVFLTLFFIKKQIITMGSHKKPLCVGNCTSEDLNVIFFLSMGSGGGGEGVEGGGMSQAAA